MDRFKVTPGITFHVDPKEGVQFSDEFISRVKGAMEDIHKKYGERVVHVTKTGNALFIAFGVHPSNRIDYPALYDDVMDTLVVLSEHGTDSDILQQLLERHPKLKESPEVHRAVGAFDNMLRVIEEVEQSEDDPRTLVKKQTAARGGMVLSPQRLKSKTTGIQIPDRTDHRKRAMKGQNPDQLEEAKQAKPSSPVPPVYQQVIDKSTGGSVNDGNVFSG